MNPQCGRLLAFLAIFAIMMVFSWLSKKKKEEEEARARDKSRRAGREPAAPPEPSAATDLEGFLEQLSGKTKRPERAAPARRAEPVREERPAQAPASARAAREEPRQAPVRQIAQVAARSVERAGREAQRGTTPFGRKRKQIEERIAAASKEAEEAGAHVRAARKDITLAAATVTGAETPRLPAAALTGGRLDREGLRRAIVMMEVLGRPRGLRRYDLP